MYGCEIIVGGAASGKTRLLKERIREFEKEGDGDILFICTTGTIRYLGLHDEFNVITPENMAISECKNKTAVEIIPDTSSVKHQKDIALLITEYSQINACENNRRTMVIVDEVPNILGTELINLLIKTPIYQYMIFTMQSPLQLEQLEKMSGLSLDRNL
ncbi:MAG: AAA family ATPase [Acetatifactor sp.]